MDPPLGPACLSEVWNEVKALAAQLKRVSRLRCCEHLPIFGGICDLRLQHSLCVYSVKLRATTSCSPSGISGSIIFCHLNQFLLFIGTKPPTPQLCVRLSNAGRPLLI